MYLAWLLLAAAAEVADPAGTVVLQIEAGKAVPIETKAGSNVICDDLAVVTPEFSQDGKGFVLHAHKPGSTLCGVWFGEQQPGGLYRVNVTAAARAPKKAPQQAPK